MKVRVRLPRKTLTRVDWAALRQELHVVEPFSSDALKEAQAASLAPLPNIDDRTHLPFLTVDPPGSLDLDQAMYFEVLPDGHRIHYAISDIGAFVTPGGALDADTHTRGETFYLPDKSVPLHPFVLSEGAASLLPKRNRPAVVWTLDLDETGELVSMRVERALVRSRQRLSYGDVHALLAKKNPNPQLVLLREIGQKRQLLARARGSVDLPTPEQLVTESSDGATQLFYRAELPSEQWNEQISIVTGIAAARMMVDAGVGLLRTLPAPGEEIIDSLRRSALALSVEWPDDKSYGEIISSLDPKVPSNAALLTLATKLLRGAAYTAISGESRHVVHSGIASMYAHCTAPMRRLADRYVNELCIALSAGQEVPQWVLTQLPLLPATMSASNKKARALDRAVVDLAEAVALEHRVGDVFDGVVVELAKGGGVVQLTSPAVRGFCSGVDEHLGRTVRVKLVTADVSTRKVAFAAV